jgi:cytoskeletal protein CcmA (bactofilin family)
MTANIKETFFIKGELRVEEDLTVDGRVEGSIDLGDHNLWVAPHGEVNAVIHARNVIIAGALVGKITATEMVEIRLSGSVEASIKCPRVVIADGAKFNGNIETDIVSDAASKVALQKADSAKMSHSGYLGRVLSKS